MISDLRRPHRVSLQAAAHSWVSAIARKRRTHPASRAHPGISVGRSLAVLLPWCLDRSGHIDREQSAADPVRQYLPDCSEGLPVNRVR